MIFNLLKVLILFMMLMALFTIGDYTKNIRDASNASLAVQEQIEDMLKDKK